MTTRICETKPPEWWETGDGGNRLALLLCGACTGCPNTDPRPTGVIRDAVAYNDDGHQLILCDCGYPSNATEKHQREKLRKNPNYRPVCDRCKPVPVSFYREEILKRYRNKTMNAQRISYWLGVDPTNVRRLIKKWTAEETQEEPAWTRP
jgi:hypothetical protein